MNLGTALREASFGSTPMQMLKKCMPNTRESSQLWKEEMAVVAHFLLSVVPPAALGQLSADELQQTIYLTLNSFKL